jgi:hypothetical protein
MQAFIKLSKWFQRKNHEMELICCSRALEGINDDLNKLNKKADKLKQDKKYLEDRVKICEQALKI